MKRHSHYLLAMRHWERSLLSLVDAINKNNMSNNYTHVVASKRSAYAERCPDRTYMEQISDRQNRFVWSEKHLYRPHKHYTYDPCSWGRELEESNKTENKKLSVVERLEQLRERALERAANMELVSQETNQTKMQSCTNEKENTFQSEEREREELELIEHNGGSLHKEEHQEQEEKESTEENQIPYYFYDESDNSNTINTNVSKEVTQNNCVFDDNNVCEEKCDNKESLQSLIDHVQRLHDLLTAPRHSNKPILRLQERHEEEMKNVVVELYNRFSEARVNVNMTYNALIIVAYHILRDVDYLTLALQHQQTQDEKKEKYNSKNDLQSSFYSLASTHARIRAVYKRQITNTFYEDKSFVLESLLKSHTSPEMCIELRYILNHPLLIHENKDITNINEFETQVSPLMQVTQEILQITFKLINERISGHESNVASEDTDNSNFEIYTDDNDNIYGINEDNSNNNNSNMGELLDSEHLEMLLKCCVLFCEKLAMTVSYNPSSLEKNADKIVNIPLLRFVLERSLNNVLKLCTMTINSDTPFNNTMSDVNGNLSLLSTGNDITNEINTDCVIVDNNNNTTTNKNNIQQTLRRRVLRRSYRHPLLQEEHQKHLHIISCEDTLSLRGPKAIPLDPPTHPRGLVSSVLAPNEMSQMTNAVWCYLTLLNLESPCMISTLTETNNNSINFSKSKRSQSWATNERIIHKMLKITSYSPNYDLDVSACARLAVTLFEMKVMQYWRNQVWSSISNTSGNMMSSSSLSKLSAAAVQDVLSTNDAANNMLRLILLLSRLEYNCVELHYENGVSVNESKNFANHNDESNKFTHLGGKKLLAVLLLHLCHFRITRVPYEHEHYNEKKDHVHNGSKHFSASVNDNILHAERIVAVLEAEWFRLRGHALWKILQQLTVSDLLSAEKYYTKSQSTGTGSTSSWSDDRNKMCTACWEACLAFGSFKSLVPLQLWRSACVERLQSVLDSSFCNNKTECSRCTAEALIVLRSRYATHPHASKRVPVDDESVKYIAACVSVLLSQNISVHDLCSSWENWDVMSVLSSLTHEESVNDVSALLSEVREFLIARCEDAKKVVTFNH